MALPQTRNGLREWCLRKLGAPVLDINIDEDQIEDRIDEALRYFQDYHFDGVEKCYMKHQITASKFTLSAPYSGTYSQNDILIGQTSGAEAWFYDAPTTTEIRFRTKSGTFVPNEVIVNDSTGATATIASGSSSIFIGDVDNGYIPVTERVISIVSLVPTKSNALAAGAGSMFDFQYQWAMANMYSFGSVDLVSYQIYKQYLALWNSMFNRERKFLFNRNMDKLYVVDKDFLTNIDDYCVIECWISLDPEEYGEVYSDEFVREYATALLKQQWGTNMKKFNGIQLPGGVTLNGQSIYDEATQELEKLTERVKKEFQLPPDPFIA